MERFVSKSRRALLWFGVISVTVLLSLAVFSYANHAYAGDKVIAKDDAAKKAPAEDTAPKNEEKSPLKDVAAFASAALVVGLSVIGASIAVSNVGAAALGAVAERPELMGKSMIFVGLAEGLAIYGLIIAIMILGKI